MQLIIYLDMLITLGYFVYKAFNTLTSDYVSSQTKFFFKKK